jgi:hypothetical protein
MIRGGDDSLRDGGAGHRERETEPKDGEFHPRKIAV